MKLLITMYVTLMATIIAGVVNMIWCKTKILSSLQKPMDGGLNFYDGKRLFGDNKSWKGFLGYLIWTTIAMIIWGAVCAATGIEEYNLFYVKTQNTIVNNAIIGVFLGFAYALFELPNSFLKRRLGIVPGKTLTGASKWLFVFLDQADSLFGCALVVWLYASISFGQYMGFVLVGAGTHIVINVLLYFMKLRKNMF